MSEAMEDVIVTPEAGAEPTTEPAEIQGDQTTAAPEAGAEPEAIPAEDGGTGETTSQETSPDGTEGTKGKHQVSFEERLAQINEKAEQRLAEMQKTFEQKLEVKQAAAVKPFVEVDMAKVNTHLAEMKDAIAEAELSGDMVKALDLQDQVSELRASLKDNAKKQAEWEKTQNATQRQQTEVDARLKRIDESAEFYRAQKNIPVETWDAAGRWISEQFKADPILGRKFADMIDRQGEMVAFEWADTYCKENMGKGAAADKAKKEAGKAALLPAAGAGTLNGVAITTWEQLQALPSPDQNKFFKENPAVFQKLKDQHFK